MWVCLHMHVTFVRQEPGRVSIVVLFGASFSGLPFIWPIQLWLLEQSVTHRVCVFGGSRDEESIRASSNLFLKSNLWWFLEYFSVLVLWFCNFVLVAALFVCSFSLSTCAVQVWAVAALVWQQQSAKLTLMQQSASRYFTCWIPSLVVRSLCFLHVEIWRVSRGCSSLFWSDVVLTCVVFIVESWTSSAAEHCCHKTNSGLPTSLVVNFFFFLTGYSLLLYCFVTWVFFSSVSDYFLEPVFLALKYILCSIHSVSLCVCSVKPWHISHKRYGSIP